MATQRRRVSVPVKIGNVWMGGNHPIVVQSMTNTDTADVPSTVNQVMALAQAGFGAGARHGEHRSRRSSGAEDRRNAR